MQKRYFATNVLVQNKQVWFIFLFPYFLICIFLFILFLS